MSSSSDQFLPEGGKARRVYLVLREKITGGDYKVETSLPSEQSLCATYQVSRVTVRRALDSLEAEGLIEKRAGSGSRVKAVTVTDKKLSADLTTLMPQLIEMVERTEARLLSFAYRVAPPRVAQALGLPVQAQVQTAVRVRLLDGQPFSHLTTHVPETIAENYSEADLATTPLFRLLERSGVRVDNAHQSVTATLASPEVAAALDVAVGSALLSLDRIVRDVDGRGIEYLSALYRPDTFRLEMALTRVGEQDDRHWEPVIGVQRPQEAIQ